MLRVNLILLLLCFCIYAKTQPVQPSYLGEASWHKVTRMKEREPMAVTARTFRVKKISYKDAPANIYTRKIDAGTVTLQQGPTIPIVQQIRITGKKLPAPRVIPAPPLQTRDNAIFNITYTDKKHGFASSASMDFAEDSAHNIWIGSEKGLIRYDGYNYYLYEKKMNFPDMPDCSLAYDQQKRLWWSSDEGVFFVRNDSLFSIKSDAIDLSSIACKRVMVDRLQRVWISTKNNGVLCIEGTTMRVYDKRCGLPGNYFESVYLDKKGNLYMACRDFGIVLIEPDRMRMFFGRNKKMEYPIFLSFYEDEDGIWAGSFYSGLIRMGLKDTLQYSITGNFNEVIYDIKKAPGGIWFSCYGNALVYLGKNNFLRLQENNGLLNKLVLKLFEDSFQNIWVSNLSGFSRINENSFYLDSFSNPVVGYTKNILPDHKKGGSWIVTYGRNLLFQKGNKVIAYTYKTPAGIYPFLYLNDGVLNNDGTLWVGCFGEGIAHVNESTFTRYSFSDFTDHGIVVSIKKDAANKVWFCPTRFGLILYDNNKFWRYTKASGLLSDNVTNLLLDGDKRIHWTFSEGLQRLNGADIETFYIENKLFNDHVNDMLQLDPETRLWATNANGLLVIKNQHVYQLTTSHGLASSNIRSVIRDSTGTIWITTEKSIESFRLKGLSVTGHTIFDESDGSYILDAENVFLNQTGIPYWIAGGRKLVFNRDFRHTKKAIPLFFFKNIAVDNHPVLPNDKISTLPDHTIEINYRTIYWGRENNLQLTYLLISNQQDTTERSIQNNGSIIIRDVLPGNYRIILKANDNNEVYYSKPINITVKNFWFNTWTFRIVMGALIISGIVFYFRQKAKRQLIINELLETKVREQTGMIKKEKEALMQSYHTINLQNKEKDALIDEINHRVKNNLQFISAILEMQVGNQYSREVIQALLGTSRRIKAMSLVHELLNNKQNQKGISIQAYIKELVDNLKEMAIDEMNPVEIKMDIDDQRMDSTSTLPMGMIISELVSNSLKHAFTGIRKPEVYIVLKKDPVTGIFRLIVSDNGNGYQQQKKVYSGLGSSLIDIFSRQLEGSYTLQTHGHFIYELQFKIIEP